MMTRKKSQWNSAKQRMRIIYIVIALLLTSLACGLVSRFRDADAIAEDRKDENSFFGGYEGENSFDIATEGERGEVDCDPGYPIGPGVSLNIDYRQPQNNPGADTLTIIDESGYRVYTRHGTTVPAKPPYLYCRTTEIGGFNRLECVKFTDNSNFELQVYGGEVLRDEFLCYTTNYYKPAPVAVAPPEDIGDGPEKVGWFQLFDCICGTLTVPLNGEGSSASKGPHPYTSAYNTKIENAQILSCNWDEYYESPNKVGQVILSLDIYKVNNIGEARTLYSEFKKSILGQEGKGRPKACEEDQYCTIAINEFGDERGFYVEQSNFLKEQTTIVPSTHEAHLGFVYLTEFGQSYWVEIWATHPELDIGSPWGIDQAGNIEACAQEIILSKPAPSETD